ncbi:2-C-methyl-D-erythritol 4-phosphate cytidylyltransferase [Mycoplasma bradburyae]|uniref:2-C-methyl-D-erythritol 4-phosphate cytidylyltransferase n=1 Tax=Mycoplasma bradburyae TaxID=2963128 RepID=A0ABT5GAB7_9MOLU|nr:2-C-methyl-D-erythritol 4-phosphate cytidylyltransferase [Mycoplasma bradburyae]MDC4163301.1 2-C-methyl-D-erythritol 4-phosphate cytidylyltransferase [Mycoplasma bradburyae]MDC4181917.1 2-C-methyl-D-erythritol 4-phosphate cytidylyltransferase [Mycoplasma bradburyae]MDC4184099.1 2-C-methyl-D-erythritol 4-phosphate cytidylyltransferase [Mycoplasma bradburyae]UTS70342.1 2-C-methyl-D-erythritol 4-phosphate cytidylyltransferase [Mycoplasma bradburyae]UTS71065.1 2-C-methyl-D-erythritol 4-phosphat
MKQKNKTVGVILASGSSRRLNLTKQLKQFYLVDNKMIYEYSLDLFLSSKLFNEIYLVVNREYLEQIQAKHINQKEVNVIQGSTINRHASFINAINKIKDKYDGDTKLIIHDSARANINKECLIDCINELDKSEVVTLYYDISSTVISIDENNQFKNLLDRNKTKMIYTPQGTWLRNIKDLTNINEDYLDLTHFLLKLKGIKPHLIRANIDCFKITTLDDLKRFEALIKYKENE